MDATVIKRGKHRSAGYGFVTFESAKEAEDAVDKFNKTELDEREITVQIARPKAVHSPEAPATEEDDTTRKPRERRRRSLPARRPTTASTTRVFVANLPFSTTDEEMAALFEDFSIESANVARLRK